MVMTNRIYRIISEEMIEHANTENDFTKLLEDVQTFRKAELTPLILLNLLTMELFVVALETFGRKLH